MPRLPDHIKNTEESELWDANGAKELSQRIQSVMKLPGVNPKKLAPALGIKMVSWYALVKGDCAYNLFYRQIAPNYLAREKSKAAGSLEEKNSTMIPAAVWDELNFDDLIRRYAPQLIAPPNPALKEKPESSKGRPAIQDGIYNVAQDLVEAVMPMLFQLGGLIGAAKQGRSPDRNIQIMQRIVDALSYPAGFHQGQGTSIILGVNRSLLNFLDIERSEVVGESVARLIEIVAERTCGRFIQELISIKTKIGERSASGCEDGPLCIQFHYPSGKRINKKDHFFRVTVLVIPLRLLANFSPAEEIFIYHVA